MKMDFTSIFHVLFFLLTEMSRGVAGRTIHLLHEGLCGQRVNLRPERTLFLYYYPSKIQTKTCRISIVSAYDEEICFAKGTPSCSAYRCRDILHFSLYDYERNVKKRYRYWDLRYRPICHLVSYASATFTNKTNTKDTIFIKIFALSNNSLSTSTFRTTIFPNKNRFNREESNDSERSVFVGLIVSVWIGCFCCCSCWCYKKKAQATASPEYCSEFAAGQGSLQTSDNRMDQTQEGNPISFPRVSVVTQEYTNTMPGFRHREHNDLASFEQFTRRYLYQDDPPGYELQYIGAEQPHVRKDYDDSPPPYSSDPPPPYPGV